jgi:hypothetical protein
VEFALLGLRGEELLTGRANRLTDPWRPLRLEVSRSREAVELVVVTAMPCRATLDVFVDGIPRSTAGGEAVTLHRLRLPEVPATAVLGDAWLRLVDLAGEAVARPLSDPALVGRLALGPGGGR